MRRKGKANVNKYAVILRGRTSPPRKEKNKIKQTLAITPAKPRRRQAPIHGILPLQHTLSGLVPQLRDRKSRKWRPDPNRHRPKRPVSPDHRGPGCAHDPLSTP
jgi:hypothetical protein